ncbi:MAG: RIP metalloprotease RseP [Deltaproteobacteria bacterium]|nr:RIP metalloprotease RseP [Deltaproteobacteria bacterium]
MYSTVSAIIVLGILIFVHELGHFTVAKFCGVRVLKFSLGFGPKLFGFRKGDTEYLLSAIPLGGYVKMMGEGKGDDDNDSALTEEEKPFSYEYKSPWQRLAIIIAGPLANIVFAAFIFTVVYFFGVPSLSPVIGEVNHEMPAFTAGLQTGDKIVSINGEEIENWEQLSTNVRASGGSELIIDYERGATLLQVKIVPKRIESQNMFGENVASYIIGITASGETTVKHYQPGEAISQGLAETWKVSYLTVLGFIKMIERVIPAKDLGGPIMIAQMAGQHAKAGILSLLYFMGIISVNLGILNLFPIPVLDGGHLLFIMMEIILGRPVSVRKIEFAQQFGLCLLVSLMVFVFYNDLARLFSQ